MRLEDVVIIAIAVLVAIVVGGMAYAHACRVKRAGAAAPAQISFGNPEYAPDSDGGNGQYEDDVSYTALLP